MDNSIVEIKKRRNEQQWKLTLEKKRNTDDDTVLEKKEYSTI